MASFDVIELGSSDDEAEPVPKKKKTAPNAMVHLPNKVPGLVIKPAKPILPNLQKVLAGGVTITNVKTGKVPSTINKVYVKPNGKAVQKFTHKIPIKMPVMKHQSISSSSNPIGTKSYLSVNPLSICNKQPNVKAQGPKLYLPPGITVKRTALGEKVLPVMNRKKQNVRKKPKIITTVDLEDDEVPITSKASPQWYMRPEEQINEPAPKEEEETKKIQDAHMDTENNMELENNKEPDTSKYIEITIEDSPVKPISMNKCFEVGAQLPITIEDSPIKPVKPQPCDQCSDSEIPNSVSEPQSKKKLDYPKEEEELKSTAIETDSIIEIDLERTPSADDSNDNRTDDTKATEENGIKEKIGTQQASAPLRVQTVHMSKDIEKLNEPKPEKQIQANDCSEFHPVYQEFIDLCFNLENSEDMNKIVEKKIKTYYRQCPKDYVESEEFTDMVSSKTFAMKAAPDKMYLYIKDIVDELNLQRKTAKASDISNKDSKKTESDKYFPADDTEYDSKRRRQIRKLDKTIKKLHRAIQKLEEQEVEFEDEEDSVYLLTERYKERLIRVHAKFCQLTNTKMPSEPRIQIEARPGQPTGPAKRLEKWVNRKVPIGTPLPFPDFHDVLRCVRDANEEDRLGWNEADIMEEARDLFTRCGKKLQRRRQENEWRIAASRISHDVSILDPAEKSDILKKRLEENKTVAAKKELELLNKYADKQNQLKLIGEEIGDKEAEESPVESEEEEVNDEINSLQNKQKRKERLRRLLQEKTRKMSAEKENIVSVEMEVDNDDTRVIDIEEKKGPESVIEETENSQREGNETSVKESNDIAFVSNDVSLSITDNEPSKDQKQENSKSSDTYNVDSDIDELHLLQKLYSENEINSSTQESDSDSPIAISDTLDSDSETEKAKKPQDDDIISIENSSYSESEISKDDLKEQESVNKKVKITDSLLLKNVEIELSTKSINENKSQIEYENILLASSDDENEHTVQVHNDEISTYNTLNTEVILDNLEENSIENDITVEVNTGNKDANNKANEMMIDDFNGEMLRNNKDYSDTIDKLTIKEKDVVKSDESMNTEGMIKNAADKLKGFDSTVNDAVRTNQGTSYRENDVANEGLCKNHNIKIADEGGVNCEKNNMDIVLEKRELNSNKNFTPDNYEDNFKVNESIEGYKSLEENYDTASNNEKTVSTEQHSNQCVVSENVNVEITEVNLSDSLTTQQKTSKDVEVSVP